MEGLQGSPWDALENTPSDEADQPNKAALRRSPRSQERGADRSRRPFHTIAPDKQARGRCNGTQTVLPARVPLGWLDHGWGGLAVKQKAPGHCMSPGALIRSAGYRGLRRSPKRTRAATPPHGR